MRRLCALGLLCLPAAAGAQSPTPLPAPSATPAITGSAVVSPVPAPAASPAVIASPTPAPAPSATPSLLKKIGVKLMFIPPPMEGTISLGIYDASGKLVRVLHQFATADEFVAALDGFITHWDGLDDAGKPLPPGHYDAKGYMVGALKVAPADIPSPVTTGAAPASLPPSFPPPALKFPDGTPFAPQSKIRVSLVGNPLDRDRAGSADLSAGFDATGAWLQLADGLPLQRIDSTPGVTQVLIGRSAPGQPVLLLQATASGSLQAFQITGLSNMMAFDCGDFDFAGVGKW